MTDSRDFKRLVRARMAETGESYTVARSHFEIPPDRKRPDIDGLPATVAAFKRKVYSRGRVRDLGRHLEDRYGIKASGVTKLDVGVYRVDRTGAPSWIARVFPSVRHPEVVRGDAEILFALQEHRFPAERPAHDEPVSTLAGQPVLITNFLPGANRRDDVDASTYKRLGEMLGLLGVLPLNHGAAARPAGSWHHLAVNGGPRQVDVEILLRLLEDAGSRLDGDDRASLDEVSATLDGLDDLSDLPHAFIHPDPCGANLIGDQGESALIDWAGAGRGPRVASFANMLWSVETSELIDAVVAGYRRHATLEERELARVEAALVVFPTILDCWAFLFNRAPLPMLLRRLNVHRQRASSTAARVRDAFAAPAQVVSPATGERQNSLF